MGRIQIPRMSLQCNDNSNSEMKPVTFQKIRQLYAKRGKTKNRTSLLSESSVFIWRSVADSNRCNRFCRPAPSHSANRPSDASKRKISKKNYFCFRSQAIRLYTRYRPVTKSSFRYRRRSRNTPCTCSTIVFRFADFQ